MTATKHSLPAWVHDAMRLPIAFAQVREDPLLDLSVLDRIGGDNLRVMMIASGGCTAAALAASNRVGMLHLVDVNPAQMALCRLKLHLLQHAPADDRAKLLGHLSMPAGEREKRLSQYFAVMGLPNDCLGSISTVAAMGPDYSGRYECVFSQLQMEMRAFAGQWRMLLNGTDAPARSAALALTSPLGRTMDEVFDRVMALPNLVRLFGTEATRNSRELFSRHFANRTRHAAATLPTHDNPYLWQFLLGRFPPPVRYPWLDMASPPRMPRITEFIGPMDSALTGSDTEFDLIHLSNILDWLDPEQARRTLELAAERLCPGGYVLIRQLNSTLDIPSLGGALEWFTEEADALHARDRSFFYRRLHLGRKR